MSSSKVNHIHVKHGEVYHSKLKRTVQHNMYTTPQSKESKHQVLKSFAELDKYYLAKLEALINTKR